MGHGPISELRGIALRSICPDDISDAAPPPSYCAEDKKFAVNFSYEAPLENHVLTRGFSFYLETLPSDRASATDIEQYGQLVREGFGAALTTWISELWAHHDHNDTELESFLEKLISRSSSGYVLLLPPQVVRLNCPQAATFIVRIFLQSSSPFAATEQRKVAYAQKPGRTLLLNFFDYPCWQQQNTQFVVNKETHCVNITPILTHELGHSFGLGHSSEDDSIMNEVISVTHPSQAHIGARFQQGFY